MSVKAPFYGLSVNSPLGRRPSWPAEKRRRPCFQYPKAQISSVWGSREKRKDAYNFNGGPPALVSDWSAGSALRDRVWFRNSATTRVFAPPEPVSAVPRPAPGMQTSTGISHGRFQFEHRRQRGGGIHNYETTAPEAPSLREISRPCSADSGCDSGSVRPLRRDGSIGRVEYMLGINPRHRSSVLLSVGGDLQCQGSFPLEEGPNSSTMAAAEVRRRGRNRASAKPVGRTKCVPFSKRTRRKPDGAFPLLLCHMELGNAGDPTLTGWAQIGVAPNSCRVVTCNSNRAPPVRVGSHFDSFTLLIVRGVLACLRRRPPVRETRRAPLPVPS